MVDVAVVVNAEAVRAFISTSDHCLTSPDDDAGRHRQADDDDDGVIISDRAVRCPCAPHFKNLLFFVCAELC